MGFWLVGCQIAEMVVSYERAYGTLEIIVAAPARFTWVVTGRVLTVALLGIVTLLEVIVMSRVAFGIAVTVYHPTVFILGLLATILASAGTSTIMTAVFLAVRGARRYVNTLGYPFYILAGVLVPITFLPSPLRPLADPIYLYWSGNVLYGSLGRASIRDPELSLVMIVLLACASYAAGNLLIRKVIDRMRASGEIGLG
jgi:ABC-2 type transport system permease protein